ncbi:MAG: hypothetical protein ACYDB1_04605 [Acidiferrobacteraceae bacterium]
MSATKDVTVDPVDETIAQAINRIGYVMKFQTIAECVEDEAVLATVTKIGVGDAQGYPIGKPEPVTMGLTPADYRLARGYSGMCGRVRG